MAFLLSDKPGELKIVYFSAMNLVIFEMKRGRLGGVSTFRFPLSI